MATKPHTLTQLQAAYVDYARRRLMEPYCEDLSTIVATLRKAKDGVPDLTEKQLSEWMTAAGAEKLEEDPFAGESDDGRREERMEALLQEAAETVPGAAELLGLERFHSTVFAHAPSVNELSIDDMADVVVALLDFVAPELAEDKLRTHNTHVHIPKGGRWELWDGGEKDLMSSVVAIFNAEGDLTKLLLRTRPRGPAHSYRNSSIRLPIWTVRFATKAPLDSINQRWLQAAAEFRRARHGHMTQVEMAAACGKTKQALSRQLLNFAARVQKATGGRAGFYRLRNLRSRR